MKTKEELNALKEDVENLSKKLCQLTEEELAVVTGGMFGMPEKKDDERYIMNVQLDINGSSKIKTGDTRKNLTAEQLTPEYIKRQIFGSKFDELSEN